MLSAVEIPFQLENLYRLCSLNAGLMTPLNSVNDVVAVISQLARQLVSAAVGSGRTSLTMLVTIGNQVIVPLRFMESLHRSREQEELLESTGQETNTFSRIVEHERRRMRTSFSNRQTEIAIRSLREAAPAEEAVMIRVAPAAKASVETLEKFTYEGVSEEMTCPICIEEVSSGTQLTRMPCSRLFHGHCVVKWLESHHTCPLCRFELPT